jgi:hypothetical protein
MKGWSWGAIRNAGSYCYKGCLQDTLWYLSSSNVCRKIAPAFLDLHGVSEMDLPYENPTTASKLEYLSTDENNIPNCNTQTRKDEC